MSLILPSVIIGIWGVISFSWIGFVFAYFIPIFPIIFFIEPRIRDHYCTGAIKIFKIRKHGIFEYRLKKNLKIQNFSIKPRANYSRKRSWIYTCLMPCMLAVTISGIIGTDVIQNGEAHTKLTSIILVSVFFLLLCTVLGIIFSIIDTSNLMVKNKRGEKVLVAKEFIKIGSIISLILGVSQLVFFGKPVEADIFRIVVVFVIFHSVAIWYMVFFERDMVQKFKKLLIAEGVQIE